MDEMIERVARAIRTARVGPETPSWCWDSVEENKRVEYRGYARAAIEALMEMDGRMWVAGRDEFVKQADRFNAADRHEMASAIADRAPEHIVKAMLSEALSPSLKEQEEGN